MPPEKPISPLEQRGQQPGEDPEVGETQQSEIEGFEAELEELSLEKDLEVFIKLARQLSRKFSTLKETVDLEDSYNLYVSFYTCLLEATKRENLTPEIKASLLFRIFELKSQNPVLYEIAAPILSEPVKPEQPPATLDEEKIPPALSETQKLESYIDDLRQESDVLITLVAKIRPRLSQPEINLSDSLYAELLQQEKVVRDLKIETERKIDSPGGTLSPRGQMDLKQDLEKKSAGALEEARNFRRNELIPQVYKFKTINVLNNYVVNDVGLKTGEKDPKKIIAEGGNFDLIKGFNEIIGGLDRALSESLASEDRQLIAQKLEELRASLVILKKAEQFFQQLKEFEDNEENKKASLIADNVSAERNKISSQAPLQRAGLSMYHLQLEQTALIAHKSRIEVEFSSMDHESKVASEAQQLLNKIDRALQQINEVNQLIEAAQLTEFEKKISRLNLNDEINSILAIDLNAVREKSNSTARLKRQQTELERLVTAVTQNNLLKDAAAAGYEGNQKVEAKIKEILTRIEEARKHVAEAIKVTEERPEIEISKEALKKEYAEIRKELLFQLWKIEEVEPSGTFLAESWSNLGELYLRPLKKIAEQLEALNLTGYVEDAGNVGKEISMSKMLFYQFETFKPATLAKIRTPLPGASLILDGNAPLRPEHVVWLMMDGLKNPVFGDVSNKVFPSEPVQMISLERDKNSRPKFEKKDIKPTVITKLMREIDRVYFSNGDLGNGLKIEVAQIHESYVTLIEHLKEMAEKNGIPEDRNQSLRVATRAFRLHWVFTFHQSYLVPKSSPKVSDNFFYMYRWHRYYLKYVGGQIGQWLNEVTDRTFGMAGTDYYREKDRRKIENELRFTETNQYANAELLARLEPNLSPRQMKRFPLLYYDRELEQERKKQEKKKREGEREKGRYEKQEDLRKKKKGFANYSWIFKPLYQLKSRMYRRLLPPLPGPDPKPGSQEELDRNKEEKLFEYARKDEGYTIATPLQYWLVREIDDKGKQKFVRFKTEGEGDGEIATFDSAFRTDHDEYVYEEIAKQLSYFQPGEMLSYFQDLESGPFQVLSNIWKAKIKDVVGAALAPKGLNGLKKLYHYAVPFLPNIGPEIRSGSPEGTELSEAAENELTLIVAIAVLNYKIQQDFWGRSEIIKQLDKWKFEDQIIDEEDWKFLLAVTYKTKKLAILARAAGEGIKDQLEKKLAME